MLILCILLILCALYLFAIAPGRSTGERRAPFLHRNIAHRGLYEKDQTIPENSLPAFRRAVEAGYGIELDIHLTADGRLAVFHDDTTDRLCGCSGLLEARTAEELSRLRLAGTEETIPFFEEVLEEVDGRVPIILELKRGSRNRELCEAARRALESYRGPVCIESFDPFLVRWWHKNAPEYLRGQLSARASNFQGAAGPITAFFLSRLLLNFLGRPQFIAYGLCPRKPLSVRLCEKMGAMKVAWTSHGPENEASNDTVIFEHYRPSVQWQPPPRFSGQGG